MCRFDVLKPMLVSRSGRSELEALNKEIAGALKIRDAVERQLDTVYISKLHRPTCAQANVVIFSVVESMLVISIHISSYVLDNQMKVQRTWL